jgi:hypothetical protein
VVLRREACLTQDVGHDDSRLVHRHVGERALAGDVSQRPYPGGRPQVIVHRDGAQGLVDAHRADADPRQVGPAAGGDQQRLTW